jgi:parallel beta-helix repeat protein
VTVKELTVTGTGTVDEAYYPHTFDTFYWRFSIATFQASNVNLINNTVMDTKGQYDSVAINVNGGGSNTISGNNILNNTGGLSFGHSENNLIYGNTIVDNGASRTGMMSTYGISFFYSSNNLVYNNSFINNTHQATSFWSSTNNTWDNGKIGNFWSDYKTKYPNASEMNSTGIGDTPYVIEADNVDHYPLLLPHDSVKPVSVTPLPESFPIGTVIASVAVAAIVTAALLIYFKKRKR